MQLNLNNLTDSTLLIPEKFITFFRENTEEITQEEYFSKLLILYREIALSGLYPKPQKPKTSYQENDQNLIRINIRPKNEDWIELGIIANLLGISRTALFSWFLLLDFAGWGKIMSEKFFATGVPAKITPIIVKSILSRQKLIIWRRKKYYKIRE